VRAPAGFGLDRLVSKTKTGHELITEKNETGRTSLPQALRRLSRFARMREGPAGKERAVPGFGTAPRRRDLQLEAVPYFVLASLIIRVVVESFKVNIFENVMRGFHEL
jgi:hypothetical protein